MEIRKSERIAIVGYNGAGKTTLTKLLMRLYDPNEGEILYNGENIKNYTLKSLQNHIAAVFQDYRIFACTLAENVAGGTYELGQEEQVKEALMRSSFGDRLNTLPNGVHTQMTREFDNSGTELSGGEQQRVVIARALLNAPGLILADEPTGNLDPETGKGIMELLYSISQAGMTVIMSTHNHQWPEIFPGRKLLFEGGKIIEE